MNSRSLLLALAFSTQMFVGSFAGGATTPPAADPVGLDFFLKAAEKRSVPDGLPQMCAKTVERAAHFLFSDAGIENAIRDETGKQWPPYLYHAVIDDDNKFSYRISYPAGHNPYLIEAFLNYYNFTGNVEALRRARQVADWTISHSTPSDYKWPLMPWSTFSEGKPGGLMDKESIEPDKGGYMGLAYARLFEVTSDRRYLNSATAIADTLQSRQLKNGSWPFRVNPKTGEVFEEYTAALAIPAAFMERMFEVTGNKDYKNSQITAWMWVLRNPVRTGNWSGFFEDIKKDDGSQVYYVPAQTIRLLLRYRSVVNEDSYMAHARYLFNWVMDGLAFDDRDLGLILREQTSYLAATPSSTMCWGMMAAEFFLATGEEKYRATVLEGLRNVTRNGLKPDGRTHNTILGPKIYGDTGSWYSLTTPVVRYIIQDMGCLPELAPEDENHLLRTSTEIQEIHYDSKEVAYRSLKDSVELLKVSSAPRNVNVSGKAAPKVTGLKTPTSWTYNPESHVLLVRHAEPDVKVVF